MINDALRLMRVFHDIKQKELAEKLGISSSHLSEVESGKKAPTLQLLQSYAEHFGIPLSSILFFSENVGAVDPEGRARNFVSGKIISLMKFMAERAGVAHAD
jgi:transcriptional regulator with XRE-family HTH domain